MSAYAPIALFAYNRPDHFARVAQALAANREAEVSQLFVFSDAPKRDADSGRVAEVRVLARRLQGFKSVELIEQQTNQGVAKSIINGVTNLVSRFGRVIVLEDDLLPSSNFLAYLNKGLDLYALEKSVASIAAYMFPVEDSLPPTFFVRGADCWGWATWARSWAEFEPSGAKLLNELREKKMESTFDFNGSYPYVQMLEDQIQGKNDSWAIRWYASAFLRNRLTLYPRWSQIQNIGADGSGVHVGATTVYHHTKWGEPVTMELLPAQESAAGRRAFARGLRRSSPSLPRRIIQKLAHIALPRREDKR
jgi:hypothetical protein